MREIHPVFKMITTAFIWLVMPMTISSLPSDIGGGDLSMLTISFLIGVVLATRFIWRAGNESMPQMSELEKAKRVGSPRIARLMNTLNDQEMEELRARLAYEQEETVPLEDLIRRERH